MNRSRWGFSSGGRGAFRGMAHSAAVGSGSYNCRGSGVYELLRQGPGLAGLRPLDLSLRCPASTSRSVSKPLPLHGQIGAGHVVNADCDAVAVSEIELGRCRFRCASETW